MGDYTSVSLTVTCSEPELARRAFELLSDTLENPTPDWETKFPEALVAATAGLWLPYPKGEYGIDHMALGIDDQGNANGDVYVELSSCRTCNARFQASAVVELSRSVDPQCTIDTSLCVPEDYTIEPGDENPFREPFDTWGPDGHHGSSGESTQGSDCDSGSSGSPDESSDSGSIVDYALLKQYALEFVTTVDVAGGLNNENCPVGDPGWLDLGMAYIGVCRALGREPSSTSGTVTCALCDKLLWLRDSWSPHDEAICAECDTDITGRKHPPSLDPRVDPEPGGTGKPLGNSG